VLFNRVVNGVSGDYPQPELLPPLTSSDKDRRKIPSLFDFQFTSPASLSSVPSTTSSTTSAASVAGLRPPLSVPQNTM